MSACIPYIQPISEYECVGDSLSKINNNFKNLETITCGLKTRVDNIKMIRTFFYYGPNSNVDARSGMEDGVTSRPSNMVIYAFVNSPEQLNLRSISNTGDQAYVIYQKTGFQYQRDNVVQQVPFVVVPAQRTPTERVDNTQTPVTLSFVFSTRSSRGQTIEPLRVYNDTRLPITYTVSWRVTDANIAHMRTGNFSFNFTLNPGTSTSFRNLMFNWLGANVGRGDVFIRGTIRYTRTNPAGRILFKNELTYGGGNTNTFHAPTFIIWRLTYNGGEYLIDSGFPKFSRNMAYSTSNNWNQPQNWTTYNSW